MKWKDVAFFALLIIVLLLVMYVFKWTKGESYSCVSQPIVYGVTQLEKYNKATISCICTARTNESSTSVILDRDGFRPLEAWK
jgi:hypothetical protein